MKKIRFAVQSSRSCFRKWKCAPRIFILLGLIACFVIIYAVPFAENAKVQGESLQCVELFTALLNWRFSMLMFSSAVILLFGDLPVVERFTANTLIRGSRRSWVAGQIMYVIATALLLGLFILFVTLLVSFPSVNFANEWSRPVKALAMGGRVAIDPARMKLSLPQSILADYMPWQAFGHSFALFFFMSCFYGMASLALKLRFRSGGFVVLLIVNTTSWAANMFGGGEIGYAILSILSVHYHTTLHLHAHTGENALLPSLNGSYAILIGIVGLLLLFAWIRVKYYDFTSAEDEQL